MLLASVALPVAVLAAPQSRSTSIGVYTALQADRGHAAYERVCAGCHGGDLRGDEPMEVPPLTGEAFDTRWRGEPLAALYDKAMKTMPADRPGSLSPREYADIVAYLLQTSGVKSGMTELPADAGALREISFDR